MVGRMTGPVDRASLTIGSPLDVRGGRAHGLALEVEDEGSQITIPADAGGQLGAAGGPERGARQRSAVGGGCDHEVLPAPTPLDSPCGRSGGRPARPLPS
jgi:hypothetical protein